MTKWKRVTAETHAWLREAAEEEPDEEMDKWQRWFVPKGKRLWPLLCVTCLPRFMPRELRGKRHKVSISGSIKTGRDAWYDETHGIPTELLGDVEEMFAEFLKDARK